MDSEPENRNSESDTDMSERGKEEEIKKNPLSKLFNKLSNKLIKKDEGQIKSEDSADKQQGQMIEESEKETDGQQRQTDKEEKEKTDKKQRQTKGKGKEDTGTRREGKKNGRISKISKKRTGNMDE